MKTLGTHSPEYAWLRRWEASCQTSTRTDTLQMPIPSHYAFSCLAWAASYSDRKSSAVGVRAAMRPGMVATRLANTNAPNATVRTETTGTVG